MQAFHDDRESNVAFYRYDASGERDLKLTGKIADININGRQFHRPLFDNATLYTGNLMTVTPNGYIKHYFAESERILSNVAGGGHPMVYPDEKLEAILDDAYILSRDFTNFAENCFMNANDRNTTCEKSNIDLPADWSDLPNLQKAYVLSLDVRVPDKLYYFHADHLGGGSIITDETSKTYQTLAYAPYGESLVNIRHFPNEPYDERYQFTGYERDEETGLSQAKNRYYDSRLSIFYSVDALAEKFPNIAGYAYCSNNPVNFIDPDGKFPIPWILAGSSNPIMLGTADPIMMTSKPVVPEPVMQMTRVTSKMEWHHLIPKQLFKEPLRILKDAVKQGFKKDGAENKIPVEKFVKDTGKGQHGNHPDFTKYVEKQLKKGQGTGEDALNFVRQLVDDLKQTIKGNPDTKINDLFKSAPPATNSNQQQQNQQQQKKIENTK
jgi:RHS repeat-associated protein